MHSHPRRSRLNRSDVSGGMEETLDAQYAPSSVLASRLAASSGNLALIDALLQGHSDMLVEHDPHHRSVHSIAHRPEHVRSEEIEEELRDGSVFIFDPENDILPYESPFLRTGLSHGAPPIPISMQPKTVPGRRLKKLNVLEQQEYHASRGRDSVLSRESFSSSNASRSQGKSSKNRRLVSIAAALGMDTTRAQTIISQSMEDQESFPSVDVSSSSVTNSSVSRSGKASSSGADGASISSDRSQLSNQEHQRKMSALHPLLLADQAGAMDEENLVLHSGEEAVAFFSRYGKKSPIKFVYLTREYSDDSLTFRPYNLIVVRREATGNDYFTMSAEGVVRVAPSQPSEFVSLSQWMRESTLFNVLTRIRFFKTYLIAKAIRSWRKNVRFLRFCKTRSHLNRRLFLAKPAFSEPFSRLHSIAAEKLGLASVMAVQGKRDPYTISEFDHLQEAQRNESQHLFEDTIIDIDDLLSKVCENVVARANAPDASNAENWEAFASGSVKPPEKKKSKRVKSMTEQQQEEREIQKALRRAQEEASMLKDFIRLADFVVTEHLIRTVLDHSKGFLEGISGLVKQKSSQRHPITFKTTMSFNAMSEIDFDPELAAITHNIQRCLQETVNLVSNVSRVLFNQHLSEFFKDDSKRGGNRFRGGLQSQSSLSSGSVVHAVMVGESIRNTNLFQSIEDLSHRISQHDFQQATQASIATYRGDYRSVHQYASRWDATRFSTADLSSSKLRVEFDRVDADNRAINQMPAAPRQGMISVDHKELQDDLVNRYRRILSDLRAVLHRRFETVCTEASTMLEDRISKLQSPYGEKLDLFAAVVREFNSIQAEYRFLEDRVMEVKEMKKLMDDQSIEFDREEYLRYGSVCEQWSVFEEVFRQADLSLSAVRTSFTDKLELEIRDLDDKIRRVTSQLTQQDSLFKDPYENPDNVLGILDEVRDALDVHQERADVLSGYLDLFRLRARDWDVIEEAEQSYKYERELWEMLRDFRECRADWDDTDVRDLDGEDLIQRTKEYYSHTLKLVKRARKLSPTEEDDPVAELFKEEVHEWQEKVPVLSAISGQYMKKRHWQNVFSAMNKTFYEEHSSLKVAALLGIGICEHAEVAEGEAAKAQGEASLEKKLNDIAEVWEKLTFEVLHHREQRDVFIIGGIDEVVQQLEENQIDLSAMLGHRYVSGIRKDVEMWDNRLSTVSEVLDEWITCQKNWMYLEFIFSSEDIQKQLPNESAKFHVVDKTWKDLLKKTNNNPNVLVQCTAPGVLDMFIESNKLLDEIQKSLEEYLETKRSAFPRFYFLSNDELLAILSQTREPRSVQEHLRKCFDAIASLDFVEGSVGDIVGMVSAEDEKVSFSSMIRASGAVEDWLRDVESMMRLSLYNITYDALRKYSDSQREQWLFRFPAMSILCVDQIMWTQQVTDALNAVESGRNSRALKEYADFYRQQIERMVLLVRGKLSKLDRATLGALIVLDVHARDVVDRMIQENVSSALDFQWTMQLRYYWDTHINNCVVRQMNASFSYGYEYLGNQPRLVITPLTDRCYLTCTGALKMHLGASPQGPAGTGKTETVKDLGKALARHVVVFNCSDSIEHTFMARMFSGLAQCGAWACFDEFNRIDIEVLSVIAQQILTIQGAIIKGAESFLFIDHEIPLNPNFGVFITMNPGYAGRTELPDNLKALFRPVAMMIPDYALIAEIMLFSEGFSDARSLAQKMVKLFKLSSEQLSKQDHYDFGMRAVKSILVMAGSLKRREPDLPEDTVLIRAMRDANVPKFLAEDVELFMALIQDLFPGIAIPDSNYGALEERILQVIAEDGKDPISSFVNKVLQLHETMVVRHGVMLVGQTGSGKTMCATALERSLTRLAEEHVDPHFEYFARVHVSKLNPKSVMMSDLYGSLNETTGEWHDGLIASLSRKCVEAASHSQDRHWIVFDGPVDAIWIENMNTVLDDNKMLCLPNGERIKLPSTVSMMFEVQDLAVASPATVSRCGMVYLDESVLEGGWRPQLRCWIEYESKNEGFFWGKDIARYLSDRLEKYLPQLLSFVRKECKLLCDGGDLNLVMSLLSMLKALAIRLLDSSKLDPAIAMLVRAGEHLPKNQSSVHDSAPTSARSGHEDHTPAESHEPEPAAKPVETSKPFGDEAPVLDSLEDRLRLLDRLIVFAIPWSVGGALDDASRARFSSFCLPILREICSDFPALESVWDFTIRRSNLEFIPWTQCVPTFYYDPNASFFTLLVPSVQTARTQYLLDVLASKPSSQNMLITGDTGVGKTVIAMDFLRTALQTDDAHSEYTSVTVNFSAQTSAAYLQETLETKLEKKGKSLSGPGGKQMIFVIDDLNMPALEKYGAQPPIELLRQIIDQGGMYDKQKLFFKKVKATNFITICAPPGGGRNPTSRRLLRHFHILSLPQLDRRGFTSIFEAILTGFFTSHPFEEEVRQLAPSLVSASLDIYDFMSKEMLPTPSKMHYTFNLRDLSKVMQGITQVRPLYLGNRDLAIRLWCHETARVFHDRLIDHHDRKRYLHLQTELLSSVFGVSWSKEEFQSDIFGSIMDRDDENLVYRLIPIDGKLHQALEEFVEEYNVQASKNTRLVFFEDAIKHVCRISRVLKQPRGNLVLAGMGGSGRQSLTRIAAYINDCSLIQPEITRSYGVNEFRDDLKRAMKQAGCKNRHTVFLLSDTQIVHESFLEDINCVLNTGEVPNIYASEDFEDILHEVTPLARAAGKLESREVVMAHYIDLVRENLHIVLALSPIGEQFRTRIRQYPALVNNCTIDWFDQWPEDALYSVARSILGSLDLGLLPMPDESNESRLQRQSQVLEGVCRMCVRIHQSSMKFSELFYQELRRRNYTTPTSYLELLGLYESLLREQASRVDNAVTKFSSGLSRLISTNQMVTQMEKDLSKLQPILEQNAKEVSELLIEIQSEQAEADEVREVCSREEKECLAIMSEVSVFRDDCERDLQEALPALKAAEKAVSSLSKDAITEVKSFKQPPDPVVLVLNAVCVLKGEKLGWDNSLKMLSKNDFRDSLINYPRDRIPAATLKKLKTYIEDENFVPDKVERVSKAAHALCVWVLAMDKYAKVSKEVEPKRMKLEEAEEKLSSAKAILEEKQAALQEIEARVAALQRRYDDSMKKKSDLESEMKRTELRLERASKLMSGLADERVRWSAEVERLTRTRDNVVGDALLAAGGISYLGPFTSDFRRRLFDDWISSCKQLLVPVNDDFRLSTICEPVQVREWKQHGLPSDEFSVENGVLVSRGRRWPLMVDPQGQANSWIKSLERSRGLKILKLNDDRWVQQLENCITLGVPALLENVGESLDPVLDPLLGKQIVRQGARLSLRLGDKDLDYSKDFRFYMTTKNPNPHYMPEVCIKVTIINFTVTPVGLEEQLLADVVRSERPELEIQRDELIVQIAQGQDQLMEFENRTLKLLAESDPDTILDGDDLINTLAASKKTSTEVNESVQRAEVTAEQIDKTRNSYRPVAVRGSVLYFVIVDLSALDPMYQTSLQFFKKLFQRVLDRTEKSDVLETRLEIVINAVTSAAYSLVCRGLFEKHKPLFAFMMAVGIDRNSGYIRAEEWDYFLRGSGGLLDISSFPTNPYDWLPNNSYFEFCALSQLSCGRGLLEHLLENEASWMEYFEHEAPQTCRLPGSFDDEVSIFARMLVLKALREEKISFMMKEYVFTRLGQEFSEAPGFDLIGAFTDSSPAVPIIFVLSPGADPASLFIAFATERGMESNYRMRSLGQGQGRFARQDIEEASKFGEWVCLQNCHLSVSWLPELERILEGLSATADSIHPDFRLWLTSMPTPQFPVAILQSGIKLTNEPPKGLRANVTRSMTDLGESSFEESPKPIIWKKLLFGLCFFHAVIQERRKFGPNGWNIPYEWNTSDLRASVQSLKMYLDEQDEIPWDALRYIIGTINYGGRVTDFLDLRCVNSILNNFFTESILQEEYVFTKDGVYRAPVRGSTFSDTMLYLKNLPRDESPEVFGLHANSAITFQASESRMLLESIISMQPHASSSSSQSDEDDEKQDEEGASTTKNLSGPDSIVLGIVRDILEQIPSPLDRSSAHPSVFSRLEDGSINSLGVVLSQEIDSYNKLLGVISRSLPELEKAIHGLVVMNERLEGMHQAFLFQRVPSFWAQAAYPSNKFLMSWVKDLVKRVEFLRNWLVNGPPSSFWISGFSFPQGFLTGVLQFHARKYRIPIDTLRFRTEVLDIVDPSHLERGPSTGVYVYGFFIEGARWDSTLRIIEESRPGELYTSMPVLWLDPENVETPTQVHTYECPCYKTSTRAGTLSTTGLSTNFISTVDLPIDSSSTSDHWIQRGVALLSMLDE